jgi:KipI family sensor histidine kinase inhibitor
MAFLMNEFGAPKCVRLGLDALVLSAPGPLSLENQQRIWRLHHVVRAWDGILECVPAMNNLTVLFDDERISERDVLARMREAWDATLERSVDGNVRTHEIAVRYGDDAGPDIEYVASTAELTVREIVKLHCAVEYVVYFVGFQPGFAYLGENDARLLVPRRATPRALVPAGSVAIAGTNTGIYPCESPGGWNIIGVTNAPLFDPSRDPATLLAPGDRVRFVEERAAR